MTYASTGLRSQADELSLPAFIRAVCLFTAIAAVTVAVGAVMSYGWAFSWTLLIGTFVGAIVGIVLFVSSDAPPVSFAGVSLLSFCLGLMMGPAIAHYTDASVTEAILITAVAMTLMSALGIIVPQAFRGLGPYLMAGLTLLIIVQFAQIIFAVAGFPAAVKMPVVTWFGVGLFLMYTAYDWTVAIDGEHTWDKAIDAAGSLILDAVNLFLRILELTGTSSSSD